MTSLITSDQPQRGTRERYVIRIQGHLASRWSEWFDGWSVTPVDGMGDGETELSGTVADQAALHGLLARIRDMNLTLLSVSRIDPGEGEGRQDER